MTASLYGANVRIEQFGYIIRKVVHGSICLIVQILRQNQEISTFLQRALRYIEKSAFVPDASPGETLRNIRCDGHGCSSELRRQAIHLFFRKPLRKYVCLQHKLMRLLPNDKVGETFGCLHEIFSRQAFNPLCLLQLSEARKT